MNPVLPQASAGKLTGRRLPRALLRSWTLAPLLAIACFSLALAATPALAAEAESCPNAARRAEQPAAATLPDCRAYEIVSPLQTYGQDASTEFASSGSRASLSGEAFTFASSGSFSDPTGATAENQYLARRGATEWSTQSITPLHEPQGTESQPSYEGMAFTPELTAGVAKTNAQLLKGALGVNPPGQFGLYRTDFAGASYDYVGLGRYPFGTSSDLSHIVFGENGAISEWVNGTVVPVNVTNEAEGLNASVGADEPYAAYRQNKEVWHAVSSTGARVYFTSPASLDEGGGQLYVRVNAEQPQSPIGAPEASGTGTLTKGSHTVTALITAAGTAEGLLGATEIFVKGTLGKFVAGQVISGPGIAPSTEIISVSDGDLTLSKPTIAELEGSSISSIGPLPFAVGDQISGNGVPSGTMITAVGAGELTLSLPAVSSASGVSLSAGGGCTVAGDACTIEVSASQRVLENPAGIRPARYWGASADGSKVFFTSDAELTENAYTGPAGNAENLYEYELAASSGEPGKLRDMSVEESGDGAGVRGVVQISEDGSYVYFVAEGVLAAGSTAGRPNLYMAHQGITTFIATLSTSDESDWYNSESTIPASEAGPEINTAVVSPSGSRLAFPSEVSLTGYDNQQAATGECEAAGEAEKCREIFLYDAETGRLLCASCNPSGARPVGSASLGRPEETLNESRPRNLLEGGVLFFDSSDRLVPYASNGRRGVYEYEGGQIYPISDVTGGYESVFLDASPSGNDVFFASADQLLPGQGTGDNVVVYDARVDGGFPAPATPRPCASSEECLPAQTPQPAALARITETLIGLGNSTPVVSPPAPKKVAAKKTVKCKKGLVRNKQSRCVKKPKKKKTKAKKTSNDRRGKS